MLKISFSKKIHAPASKVWDVLWTDSTYRKWTSVFHEGSYAVSDWKEGSEILFLAPNGDGMYSKIASNIPNKFMSFQHIGNVKNLVKQPLNAESEPWTGSFENYTLTEKDGFTEVLVELDVDSTFADFFKDIFPKALDIVKELSENEAPFITVEATVNAPIEKVWQKWTDPKDIIHWNAAAETWCSPRATNNLKVGGRFNYRMEACDGSEGFDFEGTYTEVEPLKKICYTMDDKRDAIIQFIADGDKTKIIETFQAEKSNPLELQQFGWQAILNNFKQYTEKN